VQEFSKTTEEINLHRGGLSVPNWTIMRGMIEDAFQRLEWIWLKSRYPQVVALG